MALKEKINTGKEYKDLLGRRIYPKFRLCGFKNDIPVVTLYHLKQIKIFGVSLLRYKVKLYDKITTSSIVEVSKWSEREFDDWVVRAIKSYNTEFASKESLKLMLKEKNRI